MASRTPPPAPGGRRRDRHRLPLALAGLIAAALLSLGELAARPAVAQDDFCPVDLEQSDPCDGAGDGGDAGSAEAPPLPSVTLGNPVSLVTGAKHQRETDFALDGAPLAFRRHYDSAGADVNIGLGPGWRHELSVALFARPDGGREIIESSGRRVLFDQDVGEDADPTTDAPTDRIVYRSRLPSDGVVVEESGRHAWRLPDGRILSFPPAHRLARRSPRCRRHPAHSLALLPPASARERHRRGRTRAPFRVHREPRRRWHLSRPD